MVVAEISGRLAASAADRTAATEAEKNFAKSSVVKTLAAFE